MGFFDFLGGGKKSSPSIPKIEIPPFFEDPYYKPTQDYLFGMGKDVLAGKIDPYYAPIGEIGGKQFEDVLDMVVRDTTLATEESAIRRGVGRGGPASSSIAKNVADVTSKMRWDDFLRAMQGRAGFMNLGTGLVEGVRSAGLTNQGQRNNYNLQAAGLEMQSLNQQYDIAERTAPASDGGFWDNILGAGAEILADVLPTNDPTITPESGRGGGGGLGSASTWASAANLLAGLAFI